MLRIKIPKQLTREQRLMRNRIKRANEEAQLSILGTDLSRHKKTIMELRHLGFSLRAIADHCSVSHETIRNFLIDNGVINGKEEKESIVLGSKRIQGGYVVVFVGKNFHGASKQGWMYEHRLVMQQKLNRQLEPWEVVHHKDRNKLNNTIDNLKVISRCDHPTCLKCPYYDFWRQTQTSHLTKEENGAIVKKEYSSCLAELNP